MADFPGRKRRQVDDETQNGILTAAAMAMTMTRDDGDGEGEGGRDGHLCHVRALSLFPRISPESGDLMITFLGENGVFNCEFQGIEILN